MTNRIVLIIGASSDMGLEIIKNIEKDDVILAHGNESIDKITKIKSEENKRIIPIKANLTDESETENLINTIKELNFIPHKIVHLASPRVENIRFRDIEWNNLQNMLDIQLKTIIRILKEYLPFMSKNKYGKIVFVLSSYTIGVPPKYLSHYVTAKYALLGLMKSLASEYGDRAININAVSPSMVQTNFLKNIPEKVIEISTDNHPLKRLAYPSDIAPLVNFLLSDQCSYINGVNIPISGGLNY